MGALYKVSIKDCLLRLLAVYLVLGSYQYLSLVAKTGSFVLSYNYIGFYEELIFSVDLIIFTAIFYCLGGERHYADQLAIYTKEIEVSTDDHEDVVAEAQFRALTGFRRAKALFLLVGLQLFQWALILAICFLGSVFVKGLVASAAFVIYGAIIKKRWHSNSILVCTVTSTLMFYISAKAIPSFATSQLLPILAGLFLIFALFEVAMHAEKCADPPFKLEKFCDYETMRAIAEKRGLTPREIDLLNCKFCKAMTQAALEVKFAPWSLSSIKRATKTAREKFNGSM
jgi:hypothetical protein